MYRCIQISLIDIQVNQTRVGYIATHATSSIQTLEVFPLDLRVG